MEHGPGRRRPPVADSEPDDRQETWSRERLMRMDQKFCERVQAALDRGRETLEGAAGTVAHRTTIISARASPGLSRVGPAGT